MSEAVASNAPGLRRWWHWLGIAWLLLLLVLGAQQWHLWSQQSRIDTDILALLPQDAHDLLSDVTRRIADGSSRQVVVLLGRDGAAAKRAQAAFAAAMARTLTEPCWCPVVRSKAGSMRRARSTRRTATAC